MYICGINIGHNPSLTLMKDGEIIHYNEERKLFQIKLLSGIPYKCIDEISNFKLDAVYVTSYDWIKNDLLNLKFYLTHKEMIKKEKDVYSLYRPHHLSHLFKAYVDSGFEKARVFVLDGRGSKWDDGYEYCSIYDMENIDVTCILKKLYNGVPFENNSIQEGLPLNEGFDINDKTKFEKTKNLHLGRFYASISRNFNYENEEGKFMGLQSYGKIQENILKKFTEGVNEDELKKIENNTDVARTSQVFFEQEYLNLIRKYKYKNMVFTGGCTLNVVNNYKIQKEFKDCNLYFEPLCGDEGNSISSAYFHYLTKKQKLKPNNNIYLGNKIKINESILKNELLENVNRKNIIDILEKGEIVGLVQGKAEAGPRALGNRSLLLDPSLKNAKDKMNSIKKRENFRPFACSILEENYKDYFDVADGDKSPHMMIAPQAKNNIKIIAPSIVHVDGTCRVQTVNETDNFELYKILQNFKIPLLMNTSLNLAGYPMVETFEDVLFTMRNSQLKYVFFADESKLLIKT